MRIKKHNLAGFTLIETLLLLVIVSVAIITGINYNQEKLLSEKIDKTVLQMQQILTAGLSYYVTNGSWPANMAALQPTYLPATLVSPWDGSAYVVTTTSNKMLSVSVTLPATMTDLTAITQAMAGKLPAASASDGTVTALINIPGYNLSNATQVNFAGLYHHGGCVPVPECPTDPSGNAMQAEIIVVPVSVSGVNEASSSTSVYPISSFSAYATSPAATPVGCGTGTAVACNAAVPSATGTYWRACLQVVTELGDVSTTNTSQWGQYVTVGAFVRCHITGGNGVPEEPLGSGIGVYSN